MNLVLLIGLLVFVAGVAAVVSVRKIMNFEYATEAIGWAHLSVDSDRIDRLMFFGLPATLFSFWPPVTFVVEVFVLLFV